MGYFLFEQLRYFSLAELFGFILFGNFLDFLYAGLSRLNGRYDFLDKGSLFRNLTEFVFDVLKNFHWVVLSIEHFGHYLPVLRQLNTCDRLV